MEFYILDLKDTKYDMSQPLPTEIQIRSFFEEIGIETGSVTVKPNGSVFIFTAANPCERWSEFDGSTLIKPDLALAIEIDRMRQYVQKCDKGYQPSQKEIAAAVNAVCKLALTQMKIKF
jgi:hypothetical protein